MSKASNSEVCFGDIELILTSNSSSISVVELQAELQNLELA